MTYKIIYFGIKGRAEAFRLIFSALDVKYEDVIIKSADWPGYKPGTPWGQLPILEVDGQQLAQTSTICRYLGHTFNLCGETAWEDAKCDEYVDATNDLIEEWIGFKFLEPDEARKVERKAKFVSTLIPNCLAKLEVIKEKNGGDFLVGKKLTWADINVADKLAMLEGDIDSTILEGYPNLKMFKNAVFSIPRIKAYIEKSGYTYVNMDPGLG